MDRWQGLLVLRALCSRLHDHHSFLRMPRRAIQRHLILVRCAEGLVLRKQWCRVPACNHAVQVSGWPFEQVDQPQEAVVLPALLAGLRYDHVCAI